MRISTPGGLGKSANHTKPAYSKASTREYDGVKGMWILTDRPKHAEDILKEFNVTKSNPLKLIIFQHQSPGDVLMLTATLRDIHDQYPGLFITDMRTPSADLFENNPLVTKVSPHEPGVVIWEATYPLINRSNQKNIHFVYSFHDHFTKVTGLPLDMTEGRPRVYLSDEEKRWSSRVYELLKTELPFWIIDAGRKNDFTTKLWEVSRYQELVDAFPDMLFVQIGAKNHYHPPLKGNNVLNEIGKTSIRQLCRLMYKAYGVITPVSFPMHLSAAIDPDPKFGFKYRPTIVIAGAREPAAWEAYTNHQYVHNCGMLPCSGEGGCWIARVEPLGDGDKKDKNTCKSTVTGESGQVIPKCMDMISSEQIIRLMKQYHENFPPR